MKPLYLVKGGVRQTSVAKNEEIGRNYLLKKHLALKYVK